MPEGTADEASASGTQTTGGPSLSHLPWSMIPSFKPGETEINEYTKKIEFLAGLWPPEHLCHLAPRAAMLCEGSAFKRIMRLDPSKLKVNSVEGVKLLVTTLGGIWGKSLLEDKFERFERAIFSTSQRQDESHESYLARHDYQFEELLQMGVGFEEIRAYVLLRNSGLNAEDKKKLIVDAQGNLEYKKIVSSLKLLGSRFFHEVQTGSRASSRNKTYDVNAVFEDEFPTNLAEEETVFAGEQWDDGEIYYDDNDPDAVICMQFEDSIVDALQGDSDLAVCYNTYLNARQRLTDRNKSRGFWGSSKGQYPQKGKSKGKSKGFGKGRKSLAQRILESECRRCGARGHWKAECPLNRASQASNPASASKDSAFAGTVTATDDLPHEVDDMIPIPESEDVTCHEYNMGQNSSLCFMTMQNNSALGVSCQLDTRLVSRFLSSLKKRLSPLQKQIPECSAARPLEVDSDVAMFVSHGPFGIVDLGASQTVIGKKQVPELLSHLPSDIQSRVRKVPCQTTFRFGNSSTVTCHEALLIPLAKWNVKVCVVDSQTPFLLSNNVFRTLGAQIDTAQDEVHFACLGFSMKLSLSEKKLYLLDFCELVRRSRSTGKSPGQDILSTPVMHSSCDSVEEMVPFHQSRDSTSSHSGVVASLLCEPFASPRVVHDVEEPGRSILCSDRAESPGRVHADVVSGALGSSNHVWRSQAESTIHRCSAERSEVRELVCQEVREEPKTSTSILPLLPEPLRREEGDGIGHRSPRISVGQSDAPGPEGQIQVCSQDDGQSGDLQLVRRGVRPIMECAAGGEPTGGAPQQHGSHPLPDCSSAAEPGPFGEFSAQCAAVDDLRAGQSESEFRSWIADSIGCQQLQACPGEVLDPSYFQDILMSQHGKHNWVYEEMWQYWHKKHAHMSLEALQRHWTHSYCDVLEVYCSQDSQLTQQASMLGLKARRFGLRQGDLSTFQGRCQLYDTLWILRPQHVWVAPKCAPWSNWNHLNAAKSLEAFDKISASRRAENVHLLLCDGLFRLQDWRGDHFHFHLEQPQGSEMLYQDEMQNIVDNTLKAVCDMCTAGQLRHPISHEFLRKRTQILTTSEIMWRTIQRCQCVGSHHHDQIAGSCKVPGYPRMPVSRYTELYTATFGRRLSRAIQCSCHVHERVFGPRESVVFAVEPTPAAEVPEPKRRRLSGKFHPEQIFVPSVPELSDGSSSSSSPVPSITQSLPTVDRLLTMAEQCAPRVGKVVFQDGPFFEAVQSRYLDRQIIAIDVCRGVDRLRVCPIGSKGLAPFRRSFGKRRGDLQAFEDPDWEAWEEISKRQQIRSGTPSRLLVTVFASRKRLTESDEVIEPKRPRAHIEDPTSGEFPQSPASIPNVSDVRVSSPVPHPHEQHDESTSETTANSPSPETIPRHQEHGLKFRSLDMKTQNMIKKIHQNLGHPDNRVLQMALKRSGWSDRDVAACSDFVCSNCFEHQLPKIARPGRLAQPRDFNDHVSFDGAEWRDPQGKVYSFYHFIDSATNFHMAIPSNREQLKDSFLPFLMLGCDGLDLRKNLCRAERHGATLMHMIDKFHEETPIQNQEDFNQCLMQLCHAKNAMSRHEGYTPELWVLGKVKPIPGSNMSSSSDSASFSGLDVDSTEGSRFQEQLAKREAARIAFIRADHSLTLRRALHARSRPDRINFAVGDFVMYWKSGKGVEKGAWHGPARVLMTEGRNLVWISHLTRLFRCAPEHVRPLSADEAQSMTDQDRSLFQLPARSGTGVFQFREPSQQPGPPSVIPDTTNVSPGAVSQNPHIEPDTVIHETHNPNNPDNPPMNNPMMQIPPPSLGQPDDEPTVPSTPVADDPAITTPVPDDPDDDLVAQSQEHDYWEVQGNLLIRHHVEYRIKPFFPHDAWNCPVNVMSLDPVRVTSGTFVSGSPFRREEQWTNNVQSHVPFPEPWIGTSQFVIGSPAMSSTEEVNNTIHDDDQQIETSTVHQVMFAEIEMGIDDFNKCLGKTYDYQEVYLASAAKRQKVEVKTKDLGPEEIKLFQQAKEKEVSSWLSTETVRRILRHKIPEGQLLRSRWVLTWKPLDAVEQAETGLQRKAKARLVILGYEDPLIDSLPRDSPTLGRDSRMLALQCIASFKWSVRSFDIRTAFLRGSRQDSRVLGMEPPPELRTKMKLQDNEVCELLKGAYGLINAPLLWYNELKNALLSLGFVISPMDPCLFVLPRKSQGSKNEPKIHGVLGVHVDDGLGGGDHVFSEAIRALEKRYPFRSQRQGSFTFTGIQLKQEVSGDIILSQQNYINDVPPINVSRDRRRNPEAPVSDQELQDLRGLIGSLQYSATNTRPDLSCRLSLLQARVTCATVADLLQGNRLLNDAKRFSDTEIRIKALEPEKVRFLSFSDAAFATREKAHSQKGCLILATTDEIDQIKSSQVSPLIWFSKKISRVVASTLASETYALSGALDLLSWTRLHWAWILNPQVNWRTPEETLKSLPQAFAVVDCKSLYDLLQKTSIPQCTEHRTALEALVIRDRLKEGVLIKWVHSAAQMADSLTKDMDTSVLRSFLAKGKCILHDVDEILKQRADKKVRQQWYQQNSEEGSGLHAFAVVLGMMCTP
eukprot:s690_g37.t1